MYLTSDSVPSLVFCALVHYQLTSVDEGAEMWIAEQQGAEGIISNHYTSVPGLGGISTQIFDPLISGFKYH